MCTVNIDRVNNKRENKKKRESGSVLVLSTYNNTESCHFPKHYPKKTESERPKMAEFSEKKKNTPQLIVKGVLALYELITKTT